MLQILFIFCIFHVSQQQLHNLPETLIHFKHLQQQIASNIFKVNSRYGTLTRNLKQFINEIQSKTTVPAKIQTIQSQIHENYGFINTRTLQCQDIAKNAINSLSASAKDDVATCIGDATTKLISNITIQAEILIAKATSTQGDVTGRIASCVKNNLVNEAGLALCLLSQAQPIEAAVSSLVEEIEQTIGLSENVAQGIIFDLGNCVLSIENVVDGTGDDILNTFRSCSI